jgi:hypothetical protein
MSANNGRFKAGNAGGPGRPRRAVEEAYRTATISACPLSDWRRIVKKAVKDAIKGSACARRWLSDMLIGRDPVALADMLDELRSELRAEAANGRSV